MDVYTGEKSNTLISELKIVIASNVIAVAWKR